MQFGYKRHLISEGVVLNWILCCQTDAAEQDEEEDEVGEDVVVDDLVAQNPEPTGQKLLKGTEEKATSKSVVTVCAGIEPNKRS